MNITTKSEIKKLVEDQIKGDCLCDYISKSAMTEYLADFRFWLKHAKPGNGFYSAYYYAGIEYKYTPECKVVIWRNEDVRENGEPIETTPMSSTTDLEIIKAECEKYDIESTGCIEIYVKEDNEPILHYEKGIWKEVA